MNNNNPNDNSNNNNIYSSPPAFPILASSTLQRLTVPGPSLLITTTTTTTTTTATATATATVAPGEHQKDHSYPLQKNSNSGDDDWSLKSDFQDGFSSSGTAAAVFRCGVVLGLSWLRQGMMNYYYNDSNNMAMDDSTTTTASARLGSIARTGARGNSGDNNHNRRGERERVEENYYYNRRIGEVSCSLLAKLLRAKHTITTTVSDSPRAFIIHPINSHLFAPDVLLESLLTIRQHAQPRLSRDEAIGLLDAVQLFPVFDLPGAIQAITAVSNVLDQLLRSRSSKVKEIEKETRLLSGATEVETLIENDPGERNAGNNHSTILLIVEGLDTLAEEVIRTSNPLRGSALLIPVLQALTHLSRTHASILAVMLVNTSGLGTVTSSVGKSVGLGPAGFVQVTATLAEEQQQRGDVGEGLHSIFSRPGTTTSLSPTLLSRALDQGIDRHLLLSAARGSLVVEVIKDRSGDSTGKWTVWDR